MLNVNTKIRDQMTKSVSCALYDYLEIACMFHYLVSIRLTDGTEIRGKANTVAIDEQKNEILFLHSQADEKQNKQPQCIEIPTFKIIEMEVLTANARFKKVQFK